MPSNALSLSASFTVWATDAASLSRSSSWPADTSTCWAVDQSAAVNVNDAGDTDTSPSPDHRQIDHHIISRGHVQHCTV